MWNSAWIFTILATRLMSLGIDEDDLFQMLTIFVIEKNIKNYH